jgi:hypothetical protein
MTSLNDRLSYLCYINNINITVNSYGLYNGHKCTLVMLRKTPTTEPNYDLQRMFVNHEHVILDLTDQQEPDKYVINHIISSLVRYCFLHIVVKSNLILNNPTRVGWVTVYDPDLTKTLTVNKINEIVIPIRGYSSNDEETYIKRLKKTLSEINNFISTIGYPVSFKFLEPKINDGSSLKNIKTCIDLVKMDSSYALSMPYNIIN